MVVIEVFLTAAFVFSVFMLATEKHKATVCWQLCNIDACSQLQTDQSQYTSPIGIGLALFITQLVGGPFTGASLNPSRSFGAAVAAHHFPGYHWIYWLGPFLGSLLAVAFYKIVKVLEIETALVVQGENFLGHCRGVSNTSNPQVDAPSKEVHVLDPVAESDLEKGLKTPGSGSAAAGPSEHSKR